MQALMLARFDGSSWSTEVVDPDVSPPYSSLAFDPAGNPAIAYNTDLTGSLKFAHWNDATEQWDIETVDTDAKLRVRLAYDPDTTNPAIAYTISGYVITFARWNGSAWDYEAIDDCFACYAGSLAFDSSAIPFIAYESFESRLMNVAYWNGVEWDIDAVETGNRILGQASLNFDPAGNPTVSYFDWDNGVLKFARKLPQP